MALARIHNFSISLDGFGTGEGLSHDAYFGHAGDRLHEWMFATRFWRPGGSGGVDDAFGGDLLAQRSHTCDVRSRRRLKPTRSGTRCAQHSQDSGRPRRLALDQRRRTSCSTAA